MKKIILTLMCAVTFCFYAQAQVFKASYDPSYKTETGSGFYSDFAFIVTAGTPQNKAATITLTDVKINFLLSVGVLTNRNTFSNNLS